MKYKIRQGLDLRMAGTAQREVTALPMPGLCHVRPTDFRWLKPKLLVQPGDAVAVGTPLFADKADERVLVVAPATGTVKEVVRGEKRAIESITIAVNDAAPAVQTVAFDDADTPEKIRNTMLLYGLWPCLRQRPYAIIPSPDSQPKAIFIPCFDSAPLAPDYNLLLASQADDFAHGISILQQLVGADVPLHLCLRDGADNSIFETMQGVNFHYFSGPHPSGTVGPQIHRIAPLDKGETVWYLSPMDVARIGRLFDSHRLGFDKTFALTGPAARKPHYYCTVYGADVSTALHDNLPEGDIRQISGNVLTGKQITDFPTLGFYDYQITLLQEYPERELLGWLLPGFRKWSFSHTFTAWMTQRKPFWFNTSMHGGARNFVMTDVYDKVFPFEAILPLELLKACITHDIEKMEELGIYEVDSEDFALCEVVCPSKTECQQIILEGLKEIKGED